MDGCLRLLVDRRRWLQAVIALILCTISSLVFAVEPKRERGALSKGPVRVVQLNYLEPDGTRSPVVEVWSNGLVKAIDVEDAGTNDELMVASDRLSEEELQELHDLLFQQCQIASHSTEGIEQALESASRDRQLSMHVEGAAGTEIGVLVGNRWHVVTCPAVSILSIRFPEVVEVQDISLIQARLQNIAAVALVGGRDNADRHAVTATQRLHKTHPEAEEITRHDMTMVRRLPNGGQLVQFRYAGSPGQSDGCLVCVTQTPHGRTRVSLMESPSVIR